MSTSPATASPAPDLPPPRHAVLDPATGPLRHPDLRGTLASITEGVALAAGFRLAAVSVFRTSEELEFLVVSGDEQAQAELIGDVTPTPVVLRWLAEAEQWGGLRFLPHDRAVQLAEHVWVGDHAILDHPDAWQPYDMLFAPLRDRAGQLQGILWVDLPLDGLRPGPREREEIEGYARRAAEAILVALEASRLTEQVRLAAAARRVVRDASAQLDLDHLLDSVVATAREGFRVDDVRVLLDSAEDPTALDELSAVARRLAHRSWAAQRVAVVSQQRRAPGLLDASDHAVLLDGLRAQGDASLLLAPLGAGTECLGRLVMFRRDREDWSDEEAEAALDIGHDLGRAVLNARSFRREQHTAAYKQQLIGTMAHELQNPLAAVSGYVSILEDLLDDELAGRSLPDVEMSLRGIARAANRLGDIVGDLLTLASVDDAGPARLAPVDLRRIARSAGELLAVQATARDIHVVTVMPDAAVEVHGDATELEGLVTNLISNAVKYSHDGGEVRLTLRALASGQVLLEVADDGIGISADDQPHLYDEFFRAADPASAGRTGTGLGLAIVRRVVERHRGSISLRSAPGRGSTFSVLLPAAVR